MPNFKILADNWDIYRYPWRPDQIYIAFLKAYISPHSHVCILGSTIEYRELCNDIWCTSVDIYDSSHEMLHKDGLLSKNENLICDSWENISKSYDIILWDLIFFLLPEVPQKAIFQTLLSRIKDSGNFIVRHAYSDKKEFPFPQEYFSSIQDDMELFNTISFYECIQNKSSAEEIRNIIQKYFPKKLMHFDKSNFINFVPYGNKEKTHICYEQDLFTQYDIFQMWSVYEKAFVYKK